MKSRRTEVTSMSSKMPPKAGQRGAMPQGKPKLDIGILKRIIRSLVGFYPKLVPVVIFCIIFSAVTAAMPALFTQNVVALIEKWYVTRDWAGAKAEILPKILLLVGMYLLAIVSSLAFTQIGAYLTQGFLFKMRGAMFEKMQSLPIRYFDRNKHGDIMSRYTNDIDTLRQLVSQAIPTLLQAGVVVISVLGIMLWFSVWMTLVVVGGVIAIMFVSGKIGGGSAKFFVRQGLRSGNDERSARNQGFQSRGAEQKGFRRGQQRPL